MSADPVMVGIIIVVVLGVVAYIVLKRHNTTVGAVVSADASAVAVAIHRLASSVEGKVATVTVTPQTIAQPIAPMVIPPVPPTFTMAPVTPAATPLPTAAPPAQMQAGARVDPLFAPGTPGTVTMPATGHVLSIPQPQNGELILSYVGRTLAQTVGNAALIGGVILAQGHGPSNTGNPGVDWPIFADWYFNMRSYMTPAQLAKADADAAAWGAAHAAMQQQAAQHAPAVTADGNVPIQG